MTRIRPARADDATVLAELNGQLGYPSTEAELRERLEPILASDEDAILVADVDGRPVGWVHVSVERGLAASFTAGLRGLVVDEAYRSQHLGHELVAAAERWAGEHGCRVMTVRSRTSRERAHRFYEREGYRLVKTSHVYEKELAEVP